MSKKERWLSTVALILAVLPLLLTAFFTKLLPPEVPIITFVQADGNAELSSKYGNLMAGLFCIVPLFILFFSQYVKSKRKDYNILPAIIVSMAISAIFTGIVLQGVIVQLSSFKASEIDLKAFDFLGFACVLSALLIAILGNVTRYVKPDSKHVIKNKYTKDSDVVFKVLYSHAATVQTLMFIFVAIAMSFMPSFGALGFLLVSIAVFVVWFRFHAYSLKQKYDKKHNESEEVHAE